MSSGSTSYPTGLDSNTVRTDTHEITSTDHNDHSIQIEAIEAKVGADSSAVATSHDYKLGGVTGTDKAVSKTGTETLTNKTISTGSTIDANTTVTEVLKKVYPIGCIYTTITSTSPATVFGFGTWVAFGAGKIMVGIDVGGDADFDVAEETGGSKTMAHTHTTTDHSHTTADHSHSGSTSSEGGYSDPVAHGADHQVNNTTHYHTFTSGGASAGNTTGGASTGNTTSAASNANNLQPYIVVYMFKRTA